MIPTYCSIVEFYIELDHGSVSSNAINGQTVSSTFRATCNQNFELSIIAKDEKGEVPLGGGLISHLTINGDDLGLEHTEVVGPEGKTFVISSTLSGSVSGTGEFQGSKVIILSTP
ncbi:MrpH family fimbial adhesin [Serratia marcescens]|uniref:MrpH family fimbial adhesin n=1 Tax=Serratia marcescens TaxID=615 RepID=UPI003F685DDA